VGPNSSDLTDRLLGIKNLLNQSPSDYDFEKLSQRLSLLEGKVSTIYVGASTETELKEKKDRIDDALRATRAATEKGYVIGGGYALIDVALQLNVTDPIGDIFVDALLEPAKLIRENAGHKVRDIILDYQSHGTYNSHNGEYEDLMTTGVIDPALVTEQALTNAVSAANMILLSTTAVYASDRKSPYNPGSLEDYK
jgi:chaperonin GroEL